MKIRVILIGMTVLFFTSCKKVLDADPENLKGIDQMYTDGNYAQGFLMSAYRTIPGYYDNSEYATDDAVTNQKTNVFLQMATGSWSAANNPLSVWNGSYGALQYLNLFIANADSVKWALDPEANTLFN